MTEAIFKIKYDFVCSIGENCATAAYLKMCCLRDASYPFDWVAGMPVPQRVDMLLNGFPHFLRKEDLVPEDFYPFGQDKETGTPVKTFRDKFTNVIFVHDFTNTKSLDEEYPGVKAKYDRRIKRLLQKIQDSKRILLVSRQWEDPYNYQEILDMQKNLSKAYPDKLINLLCLENDVTKTAPEYISLSEHVLLVKHSLVGHGYKGNVPNNMEIFTQIQIPGLWWLKLKRRMLRKAIRVLASLRYPFSHKKRHEFMEEKKKKWLRE